MIRRTVKHRVNFGDYEGFETEAVVELTTDELPKGATFEDAVREANRRVAAALAGDLHRARAADTDRISYISDWPEGPEEETGNGTREVSPAKPPLRGRAGRERRGNRDG